MCRAPIGRGQQNLRVAVQSERGSAEWPLFDCVINLLLGSDWPEGTHPRESVPFSQSERETAEGDGPKGYFSCVKHINIPSPLEIFSCRGSHHHCHPSMSPSIITYHSIYSMNLNYALPSLSPLVTR